MSDFFKDPPPKWLERLAVLAGIITLLAISGMAMLGAAFLLVISEAHADDRLTHIQTAWNAGDTVATQQDFNREEYDDMIRLAQLAEKGGTLVILDKKLVMEQPELGNVYAVRAEVNGERQVWLLQDCRMFFFRTKCSPVLKTTHT